MNKLTKLKHNKMKLENLCPSANDSINTVIHIQKDKIFTKNFQYLQPQGNHIPLSGKNRSVMYLSARTAADTRALSDILTP